MAQTDFTDLFSEDTKKLGEALNAIEANQGDLEAAIDAITAAIGAQKVVWTEAQALTFDDLTPAKTVEGKVSLDVAAFEYKKVVVQVSITFGGAADGDAQIRIRKSADSGSTKDTELAAGSTTVAVSAGNTKVISLEFNEVPWIEIGVYNGNTAAEDITISAKYAGLKYTS